MSTYLRISTEISRLFNRYVPKNDIHTYSVDESFLKVNGTGRLWGDVWEVAEKIKDEIDREFQLPCAIGIGPNMTRWMTKRMFEKAEAEEIEVQKEVVAGHSGTNGWGMQICNEGIATSVLSLPLKYMHTPVEVLEVSDVENVARLIAAFTVDLGKEGGPEW